MASVSLSQYLSLVKSDMIDYVVSESEAFKSIGTRTRGARIRVLRLVYLRGAYDALSGHDATSNNNAFTITELQNFEDIINGILGTTYEVGWEDGIWRDGDNTGLWEDDLYGGVWADNQ